MVMNQQRLAGLESHVDLFNTGFLPIRNGVQIARSDDINFSPASPDFSPRGEVIAQGLVIVVRNPG